MFSLAPLARFNININGQLSLFGQTQALTSLVDGHQRIILLILSYYVREKGGKDC